MPDDPKVIPGHVGYSPDYVSQGSIDVPSIMRAGGFEEGVKAERDRIVAWLRDPEFYRETCRNGPLVSSGALAWLAGRIERGDHLKGP